MRKGYIILQGAGWPSETGFGFSGSVWNFLKAKDSQLNPSFKDDSEVWHAA